VTRFLLLTIIAFLAVHGAAAQEPQPLFVHGSGAAAEAAAQAPPGGRAAIVSLARVGLHIDRLFAATGVAARVLLNTTGESWTARFERLDTDAAGFRSWVGAIEGIADSHVVFTERHGIVSGLINAVGTTYQVRTETPGAYLLELVDVTRLGAEHDPIAVANPAPAGLASAVAYDDAGTIDVLMLYTPRARNASGGTAQIQSLVSQIISDTNTAFARSGVSPRVRLIAAVEFSQDEAWSMSSDLYTLSSSQEAQLLREAARADLVQLLVSSPDMSTCGIGYLLTQNSADFAAYSVADFTCAAQYTPTHEMGHNMGSHHAPEDGAAGALFPYSYGFKDPVRAFRTVMAYACAGVTCDRIPNFSNPAVIYRDGPTGTSVQDNARSIEAAAFTVANFKQSAASTPRDLPPPPAGLYSSVNGNLVTVWWDDVPSEDTAFVLQVGTASGTADILSKSVHRTRSASGTLSAGTYYWRVFSLNDAGPGASSSEGRFTVGPSCLAPSAPRELMFGVLNDHVTLAWTPPVTGTAPVSYVVEAGSAPGLANVLVAPVGTLTAVGTPAPSGTYFVRVRAQNACGTSGPSNERVIAVP
jgi:peptidyl-Asp metalloendopeptidase